MHKPIKVRCACMDYNAIYSFERDELFPLPPEFSPKTVPVNIFLGRFRGTHYVFKVTRVFLLLLGSKFSECFVVF